MTFKCCCIFSSCGMQRCHSNPFMCKTPHTSMSARARVRTREGKTSRVCMLIRNCIDTLYLVWWLLKCSWSLHFKQFSRVQFQFLVHFVRFFLAKPHTYSLVAQPCVFISHNEKQKHWKLGVRFYFIENREILQYSSSFFCIQMLTHCCFEIHIIRKWNVHKLFWKQQQQQLQTIFKCLTFILVGCMNTIFCFLCHRHHHSHHCA